MTLHQNTDISQRRVIKALNEEHKPYGQDVTEGYHRNSSLAPLFCSSTTTHISYPLTHCSPCPFFSAISF